MDSEVKQWAKAHGFQIEPNGISLDRRAWNSLFVITDETILQPPQTMSDIVVLTIFGSNERELSRTRIEHGLKHIEFVFNVLRLICGKPVVSEG